MKKFILGGVITIVMSVICLIYFLHIPPNFKHVCNEGSIEDYSKVSIPIKFMPGKEKCLKYEYYIPNYRGDNYRGDYLPVYYYRNLKEFIITESGKYCLWGSKDWNEECQDASMKYAYGNYDANDPEAIQSYQKFKKVVINFIKYVQENDIEKALILTDEKAQFFTDDQANCLIQEKYGSPGHCRAYFKQNSMYRRHEGEINLELFKENLMQIDIDNIKFYLDDLSHRHIYSVVVPYEYKGSTKYFDIRFLFYIGGGGIAYPYDNMCFPKIYDVGIHNKLPPANSY